MIRIIHPNSPEEWESYYLLRWQTLRAPWGQPPGSEKDDKENESIHLFALDEQLPLGVCRIQFNDENIAQVRFMGVHEQARGKGVGKLLMQKAEEICREKGRKKIVLQARENAVAFYKSCGYHMVEKSFLLWDSIQHYLMEKKL